MLCRWIKMLFVVVLNLRELLGREAKHWPIAIDRTHHQWLVKDLVYLA